MIANIMRLVCLKVISLLRRLMVIFKHFLKVLGPLFDRELLQHSKLNCTV